MKLKIVCFLIIVVMTITSTTSYSAYSYNDKKYSDILIANNKLVSNWTAIPVSQIPPKLKPLIITKGNVNGKKIYLIPSIVLLFNNDGSFTYLWEINSSNTGEISGKWRVENSTLIFTLGNEYSSVYKKDSELRYKILKILHSDSSLKYSGTSCPGVSTIIKTTDDPLKDFANIVVAIEKEKTKLLTKGKLKNL